MNFFLDLLLKLLGVHVPAGTTLVDVQPVFRSGVGVGWVILAAVLLAAAVVWMYRVSARHVSAWRRYTLAGLRILFLLLMLLILLRPVLALTTEGSVRRVLVILCDASMSMQTADPRQDSADDLTRAAIARNLVDPTKGLKQELSDTQEVQVRQLPRLTLLKSALRSDKLDLLGRLAKDYDLRAYSFGTDPKTGAVVTDLTPPQRSEEEQTAESKDRAVAQAGSLAWVDRLDATSPVTPIGDALREVLGRTRGLPRAGILLFTDGGNNSGSDPLVVAQNQCRQENVPLYPWGIGMSSPRDIIVANMFAPEVTFAKEEVGVNVRVRWQSLNGESGKLKLMLGDEQVDEKEVRFGPDGETAVAMKFTPPKVGEYELRALIDPRDDEVNKANNEVHQHLRVIDGKIKVLLVDQSPRWEFKYLQALLARDRRVDVKFLLFEVDAGIVEGENSPYLERFPETKEELLKYDLIVFGDVDPQNLTSEQMDMLGDFVAKFGGGLIVVAGKQNTPARYAGTQIEKMLPVDLEPQGDTQDLEASQPMNDTPITLQLTERGKQSRMLQISDKPQESLVRWQELPPIYWDAPVAHAKPGAEVLLADPDPAKASRFGNMPVLALQQYGLGQVLYVGTDNTWRWRKNRGDEVYLTLWGQMIQRLSLPHLLGAAKRTQLNSDRENYITGQRVTIYARLYGENYEPVTDKIVKGYYGTGADGQVDQREVTLRAEPNQAGQYRAEFLAPAPDIYKFHVEQPGDPSTLLTFATAQPMAEQGETAMNERLLKDMAKASGGEFFREEDLYRLPDAIHMKTDKVRSTLELELWCTPLYFLLLLSVVTAEWVLRKMSQLK